MALRVAICGGGIGGLTAAQSIFMLCGNNVTVDIYEASAFEVRILLEWIDSRMRVWDYLWVSTP